MSSTACDDNQTGADMTRNELLTKLAMELHPNDFDHGEPYHWYEFQFTGDEYLQRRAELINKPSWGEAPENTDWLAQCEDGLWRWFHGSKPECIGRRWWPFAGKWIASNQGTIPAGHDWRDTLEKRPMDLYDAQDALANAYAEDSDSESALSQALSMPSKYHVRIKGQWCDVYDVLLAFGVTNPADQHAIKKMLRPGKRGHKDGIQDRREAIQSLHRAIELEGGA